MYPTDVAHLHGFCTFSVPHLKIVVPHLKLEQLAILVTDSMIMKYHLTNRMKRCICLLERIYFKMKVYEIVDMIAKTLGSIAESLTRVYVYCLHFN